MTDLLAQADQPQLQYTPLGEAPPLKKKFPRPEIVQPDDPTIRHIALTKGYVAIVDAFLYEWLNQWNWFVMGSKGKLYACAYFGRENGKRIRFYMHVYIMGIPAGSKLKGDHADGNSFNNLGSNLRYADMRKNAQNRKRGKHNKSGFKGVHWEHDMKAWRVNIMVDGVRVPLGYFPLDKKEDAGRAYDAAAKKYFGEFACLNFPDDSPAGCGVGDDLSASGR